jgi:hypothetical protein
MKKILLLAILILAPFAHAANDFSGDASWVAVYRFEDGANFLLDETANNNDLTNVNTVVSNTTDYIEGLGSADFESVSAQRLIRANADLAAGFPGLTGYTDIALAIYFRAEALPVDTAISYIITKYGIAANTRSWAFSIYNNAGTYDVRFHLGHTGGTVGELETIYSGALSNGQWYYLGFSFDDSEKNWKAKFVQCGTPDTVLTAWSAVGTTTDNNMSADTADFSVGFDGVSSYWDGEIDGVAIANTPKTEADFDAIRAGTYGGGTPPVTSSPSMMMLGVGK